MCFHRLALSDHILLHSYTSATSAILYAINMDWGILLSTPSWMANASQYTLHMCLKAMWFTYQWAHHCISIYRKDTEQICVGSFWFTGTNAMIAMIVNAKITSRLDNFNAVLVGLSGELLHKLQLVQNNAAKMVTKTKKYDHVTPLLYKLHWLPISYRIDYKIILLCFKALNNLAPVYISEMLQHKEPTGNNLRNELEPVEPRTKLISYGDRAFSSIAPRLWNKLPHSLKQITKLDKFKKDLKTYLFEKLLRVWNPSYMWSSINCDNSVILMNIHWNYYQIVCYCMMCMNVMCVSSWCKKYLFFIYIQFLFYSIF